jgi:hypothetical protein
MHLVRWGTVEFKLWNLVYPSGGVMTVAHAVVDDHAIDSARVH